VKYLCICWSWYKIIKDARIKIKWFACSWYLQRIPAPADLQMKSATIAAKGKSYSDITGRPPHSSGKKGTSVDAVNREGKLRILRSLRLSSSGRGGGGG
jgi:hypothetical protein